MIALRRRSGPLRIKLHVTEKKRRKVVRAFVWGYLAGLESFAKDDREKWHEYRIDNSPKMMKDLLEDAMEEREEFLDEKIDLDKDALIDYADICGRALAQPHARSDEDTGIMEGDAEKKILSSVRAVRRIKKDWKQFKKDHDRSAFQFVGSSA